MTKESWRKYMETTRKRVDRNIWKKYQQNSVRKLEETELHKRRKHKFDFWQSCDATANQNIVPQSLCYWCFRSRRYKFWGLETSREKPLGLRRENICGGTKSLYCGRSEVKWRGDTKKLNCSKTLKYKLSGDMMESYCGKTRQILRCVSRTDSWQNLWV